MNGNKSYLQQRRQTWYVVVAVPKDVRPIIGRAKIVKSLHTRDLQIAQRLRYAEVASIQASFARARALAAGDAKAKRITDRMTFEDRLAVLNNLDEQVLPALGAVDDPDYDPGQTLAALLSDILPDMDPRGEGHGPDFDAMRYAYRKHIGQPIPIPDQYRMTFSEAAAGYLAAQRRDLKAKSTEQTLTLSSAVFRLFTDYANDPPMHKVDRKLVAGFLDKASNLMPDWGRSPKTKERSFAELLKLSEASPERISNKTLNRYLASLRAVWKWSKRCGHVEGNDPFTDMTFNVADYRDTKWLPFENDELRLLLTSLHPDVKPAKHTSATALAWVTWIAAFSGMRLNEICSLTLADIQQREGVYLFNIDEAKTSAGDRLVPIHSRIIALGFLDYVEALRSASRVLRTKQPAATSLWPALRGGGPDNKLCKYISKRFTVHRRRIGLDRERLTFHSLRGTVGTALERARIPESEAVQVLGHEKLSMSYKLYSSGLTPSELQRVVEAIAYPDI